MSLVNLYILWIATTSCITFILYGFDKFQARNNNQRVPERTLHLCALVGGFVGGWIGRLAFRHKTQKSIFTVILLAATLIHGLAVFVMWKEHLL
jgi:uncharacterized membrane protein YsdA (DUF1294 family)